MNLLVAVDDISVTDLVRTTIIGMAIDIRNNTTKPSPPNTR